MFWALPNFLCHTKNVFTYCGSGKHFLPDKKMICSKIVFCAGTKGFEEALNAVKFLGWLEKFGQAQNIFGPVQGQDISLKTFSVRRFKTILLSSTLAAKKILYEQPIIHFFYFFIIG